MLRGLILVWFRRSFLFLINGNRHWYRFSLGFLFRLLAYWNFRFLLYWLRQFNFHLLLSLLLLFLLLFSLLLSSSCDDIHLFHYRLFYIWNYSIRIILNIVVSCLLLTYLWFPLFLFLFIVVLHESFLLLLVSGYLTCFCPFCLCICRVLLFTPILKEWINERIVRFLR